MMKDSSSDASRIVDAWYLGKTSTTYETSGNGVATISTGEGDNGGVSYGAYQLSSKARTLQKYLDQSSYREHFSGLKPTTEAFNAKWRELARTEPEFAAEQHHFIRRTHYDIRVRELQVAGIDLSDRGRAVQDALWSTSVQSGNRTKSIVSEGLTEKFGAHYKLSQLSDKDIVEAIQDYKIAHNNDLFRNSRPNWNGLLRRAREEKSDLVKLADYENTLAREGLLTDWHQSTTPSYATDVQRNSNQPTAADVQATLNVLGYTDARGHALELDGHYGKHTREAITSFQRHQGLIADGIAGPNTWAALQEAARATSTAPAMASPATVEPPAVTFPQMAPPPDLDAATLRTLQQHLNTLHLADHRSPAVPVTGTYDEATRSAVMAFQQTQGLPGTGLADPATRSLIDARATIAELQQNANLHTMPMREAPLLEVSMQTPSTPSLVTQSQPSVSAEMTPPHHVAEPPHGLGHPASISPASSEAMTAPAVHHVATSNQDAFAAIQAQLREMQRQMEAMSHQREQERAKEKEQDHARTAPYEPAPHAGHPSHATPVVGRVTHDATAMAPGLADPRHEGHPLNALYNELKTRIPDASEKRLLQFTAACHSHHISAENLGRINLHEQGDYIRFCPSWPPGPVATVDLKTPALEPQQCMAHIQQHDQQQVQLMAQIQAQVALTHAQGMQGPVLGGPSR